MLVRTPRAADEAEYLALNIASRTFYRGWASPLTTPAQFRTYLTRCQRPDYVGLLLVRRADKALLGAIELSQIARGRMQSAYLGYQIGAPFARQGYMAEGLGLALRHAFDSLKLHRLEANVQPENTASISLLDKLGFTREGYSRRYLKLGGRWRDHERWAILAEDWRDGRRRRR